MLDVSRWKVVLDLDEELLAGGILLSEWTTFIVRDADTAFVAGANLASILTAWAAIESHLKFEESKPHARVTSFELVERASLSDALKVQLHELRKYRNSWVHVADPSDDGEPLANPSRLEVKLENMARTSLRLMREVLYSNPAV